MPAIKSHFIETPRMRFHYRTHGSKDGVPMLFLHGSYASSRWWELLIRELPDSIYAITPDLRGCGQSEKSPHGYAIEEQAADVWAFIDALSLDDFDLVGHSSGGAIAVEVALNHQAAVNTLILVDSVPVEGVFTPVETLTLLNQMQTDQELLSQALASLMPTFNLETDTDAQSFFDLLVNDTAEMAPAAFTGIATALGQWNRFAEASALTLPTLLIWGDQDQIVERDVMTRSLIAIPGANNLEVLREVGHSPMIEAPLNLAERLLEFITEDFAGFEEVRESVESSDADSSE